MQMKQTVNLAGKVFRELLSIWHRSCLTQMLQWLLERTFKHAYHCLQAELVVRYLNCLSLCIYHYFSLSFHDLFAPRTLSNRWVLLQL
uniref:Uncharacterized protein n=1 Tax=Arundo donax TaxID=35708 RepID=A0A0A9CM15_ARUDO